MVAYILTIVALIYFGRRISMSVTMVFGGLLILSNYNHTIMVSTKDHYQSHHKTSSDLIFQVSAFFSRQLCQWQERTVMAIMILINFGFCPTWWCYIIIMVMVIIINNSLQEKRSSASWENLRSRDLLQWCHQLYFAVTVIVGFNIFTQNILHMFYQCYCQLVNCIVVFSKFSQSSSKLNEWQIECQLM